MLQVNVHIMELSDLTRYVYLYYTIWSLFTMCVVMSGHTDKNTNHSACGAWCLVPVGLKDKQETKG